MKRWYYPNYRKLPLGLIWMCLIYLFLKKVLPRVIGPGMVWSEEQWQLKVTHVTPSWGPGFISGGVNFCYFQIFYEVPVSKFCFMSLLWHNFFVSIPGCLSFFIFKFFTGSWFLNFFSCDLQTYNFFVNNNFFSSFSDF